MKVFISYARLNKPTAEALVRDLHALGHQAFYDRDLTGGQRWWDTLLDQILEADAFVPILSDEYRDSEACRAEAHWAEELHVAFLPIMTGEQLPGMYDPVIAEANWVVYDPADRAALADLARGVSAVTRSPRPDPLPPRPAIPLSYLILMDREIRANEDLSRHRQLSIVSDLRSKLSTRDATGARELLRALRERPDVTVEVAATIDGLLEPGSQPPSKQPGDPATEMNADRAHLAENRRPAAVGPAPEAVPTTPQPRAVPPAARPRTPDHEGQVTPTVKAYRFLAFAIALLVVVQAGAIAWGFFGVSNFIGGGGVINEEFLDCTEDCESIGSADVGFAIHMFFVGLILIPLTSLVLLIVSFFAKVPKGVTLAATIFILLILQVFALPALSREVGSGFGALHGINAMVMMGVAIMAGQRASASAVTSGPAVTT